MNRLVAHAVLLMVALIWGLTFVFQSTGMETIGPFSFIAIRFLIGAVALLPFALWERRRVCLLNQIRKERAEGQNLLLLGTLGLGGIMGIGAILQQVGVGITSVANAAFLTTLYMPLVPIFGLLLFGRNINRYRWGAVALFVIGSAMMSGVSPEDAVIGDFVIIVSASFWAGHIMLVGWLAQRVHAPFQLAFVQTVMTTIIGTIVMLPTETITWADLPPVLPELLFAGVLSTGLAFTMQLVAQRYASSTASAILLSLEGMIAAFAGWIILGQVMMAIAIGGAFVIFVAVLIIELTPERGRFL